MKTLHSGMIGTQAEIEALTTSFEGMTAYATDLNRLGAFDGSLWDWYNPTSGSSLYGELPCNGRLTLSSGEPVTTTDITSGSALYFAPYKGNRVALYDAPDWEMFEFTEITLSLSGYAADTNFDIFLYNNAGTLTLESVAWTDGTTRATALTTQDGVYVKSGATDRRYLGTIRTTSTIGQCEDSITKRFVWNYYNRVQKKLQKIDNTQHTYAVATYRAWNNDTDQKFEYICGVVEDKMILGLTSDASADIDGRLYVVHLGEDSFTSTLGETFAVFSLASQRLRAGIVGFHVPSLGYHYIGGIQISWSAAACTFEQVHIKGMILG